MRDNMRSVGYLDFWLDTTQHLALCRTYVQELKRSAFIDEDKYDETSIVDRIVSDQYTEQRNDSDALLSEYLRDFSTKAQPRHPVGVPCSRPITESSDLVRVNGQKRADLQASAEKIFYTYLLPGAEREIIIAQQILSDVTKAIEEDSRCDPEVFDAASDYVFKAMERDAFPYFMRRRRALISSLINGSDEGLWSAFANRKPKAVKIGKLSRRPSPLNVVTEE
ncbi:Bud site selection protein, Revert to axial protein 1 [Elasticomyces elasticus]|nr:Bud site selection protein, Revert to axial protein 1 [Elasticomyces elasticus]KAK3665205.1 Bud site selection protein, Revert to axial protein 1 [Elasticomyces elasticus]KAK4909843.1 Bud site selection protein, Revert to axial protein 1 [Elasticomyces elasticus]KAK5749734.1 Bud site selection protein, Revert to axial protein 1 [Elasticomyces elasticus]